jgi:DNA/RNA-binding protein KIN17
MGKGGDPFSPKAISKRIKAKGLQKLKWYCQMCEKQCRDENGFKCHCMSEGHQRQMKLFGETPGKFMQQYSSQFQHEFLHILSVQFGSKRVLANSVYQEYIKDKHHVHMNSTHWNSLGEFCHAMERAGILKVEESPMGLFVTWIDTSRNAIVQKEAEEQKQQDQQEQYKLDLHLRAQLHKAKESAISEAVSIPSNVPKDPGKKISISLKYPCYQPTPVPSTKGPDMWLSVGLKVKILNKDLGGGIYYGLEGQIIQVLEDYLAKVQTCHNGTTVFICIDQDDLELL